MAYNKTLHFLGKYSLGLYGVGHLGKAILRKLLDTGFPKEKILTAHKGSPETKAFLQSLGVTVVPAEELCQKSKILLYLVRPQELVENSPSPLPAGAIVVSFLAGISSGKIKKVFARPVFRLLPNSPDAILQGTALAGLYPEAPDFLTETLSRLGLKLVILKKEEDMHDFVVVVCLPNVYMYFDGKVDELMVRQFLRKFDAASILSWAKSIYPKGLSAIEKERYIQRVATKGGINEAIFSTIKAGGTLQEALSAGVKRSKELAKTR